MKKILIDTDIGDDIDDALAIAYALNSPELNVMGITTAFKNTKLRTQLVLQQLHAFNQENIPVATGIQRPLVTKADPADIPAHWDDAGHLLEENCNLHAVDFIVESIKKDPDIVIAAIAPLTNIACAVRKEPDIMKHAHIWMMAGMYSIPYPEWNVMCDPEAAAIVLDGCDNITMLGLDVTLKCRLTQAQVDAMPVHGDKTARQLHRWTTAWMEKSGHLPILHDPLVIAALENPGIVSLAPKQIRVECAGNHCRGVTAEKTDPFLHTPQKPNVRMGVDVDVERFTEMFLSNVFPNIPTQNK